MSGERDSVWKGMHVHEGRDIARYRGQDYDPDHNFDQTRDFEEHRAATERESWTWSGEPATRKPDVLRLWLGVEVASFEDALATVKRGRLSAAERPLYDALAVGIARLRQEGATLQVIGEAIDKGAQTVARLAARGDELLRAPEQEPESEPCRRHRRLEPDCPACLKMACP